MNGYGIAVIVLVVLLLAGMAVAVVASASAVMHYPDPHDPDRNAARFVKPAMTGALISMGAVLGLLLTGIVAIVDAVT